eukprot:1742836-Amphidinium_carterae.1
MQCYWVQLWTLPRSGNVEILRTRQEEGSAAPIALCTCVRLCELSHDRTLHTRHQQSLETTRAPGGFTRCHRTCNMSHKIRSPHC